MKVVKLRIETSNEGQRLDEFLASRLEDLSRMRIANLLSEGVCLVNGEPGRAGHHLRSGEEIKIVLAEGPPTSMTPEDIPLEINYEDEHLLVVVKPPGILVHPTKSVKRGTLANALTYHLNRSRIADYGLSDCGFGIADCGLPSENPQSTIPNPKSKSPQSIIRPGIVHRLDRATSGLMVIAKTQRALSVLSKHFHLRRVEKKYVAIVEGNFVEDEGTIDAPVGRDPDRRPRWWVLESGKPATTKFRVRSRGADSTLVELEPLTGRTNQLRIHCAYVGHPIVGDELYSNSGLPTARPNARLCLHASRLAFHHPADGKWMQFESRPPEDIVEVMRLESLIY
jgi:23S rRNA pseudouridine1911/1915/1917 synthase